MAAAVPIGKHPDNPHYFQYRGKPLVLVSSGDIYYDVFSANQDFREYLDALAAYGSNFTRLYPAGCTAFVPQDGESIILPWVRRAGGKYDLEQWNPAYFERLHAFMRHAAAKDIIVDACLINGLHTGWAIINNFNWPKLPFNAANNVQGDGTRNMNEFTTLVSESNVKRLRLYYRKIAQELDRYDNLLYDVCDEPDCYGQIPSDLANAWVEVMLSELYAADTRRHMIAQTHIPPLEEGTGGKDWCRDPRTSWINAEYLKGLDVIDAQYAIEKPYVNIETMSPGEHVAWEGWWSSMNLVIHGDTVSSSRIHAWAFLAGGGGGYLEWSAHYHPGVSSSAEPQRTLLSQMKVLKGFINGFDFPKMRRFTGFCGVGKRPEKTPSGWAEAIAEPGRQYALYLSHSHAVPTGGELYNGYFTADPGAYRDSLVIEAPAGSYRVQWVEPASGKVLERARRRHAGGALEIRTPEYSIDIALRIMSA